MHFFIPKNENEKLFFLLTKTISEKQISALPHSSKQCLLNTFDKAWHGPSNSFDSGILWRYKSFCALASLWT